MSIAKPFHRNHRAFKPGPNSGYNGWAYIHDREYAKNAEHYVRALLLIQDDLRNIFEYIEPSDECRHAYSYRIHALFMRTCIEIEANFKAILNENKFTIPSRRSVKIDDFRKVDASHHLSSFEVMLPIWHGAPPTLKPFEAWLPFRGRPHQNGISLSWYKAYNASKHDRHEEFKQANLENLIMAVAALLVVLSAQFHTVDFNSGPQSISFMGYDYHPMEASIGSLFRIKFPDDWADNEKYEFDWAALKNQPDRFEKFDFDAIP